jgi:hypothetical protein
MLRKIALALIPATAVVTLAAAPAVQAAPAVPAAPDVLNGPVAVCAALNPGLCLAAHGGGAQMTIESASGTTISSIADGSFWELHDGNGKCLRAQPDNRVVTESISCTPSDQHEQWSISGPAGSTVFRNRGTGGALSITAPNPGNNVWTGAQDWHWVQNPA